ncbi:MAG TPA: TolC family protein [Candidatus Acidoferrales bacterium]|nr:TolC family protein [Candidatus Acidoferrales bacterium]
MKASETPIAGTTTSVNTINPTVQVQGAYGGSTPSTSAAPFSGKLTLHDAIERGLRYNLGAIGLTQAVRQSHGEMRVARSALLPNVSANATETVQETNLKALGLRFSVPIAGFTFPTVVGPFNYIDFRARLSQTVLDLTQLNNYRAADQTLRANRFSAEDAHDLVTLAVGGEYLVVVAAKARMQSAQAQEDTANALFQQTSQERTVGVVAQVDLDRSQVEALTQQQRFVSLENELTKQKINLARMTGLPPNSNFDVADVPYSPAPQINVEDALSQAFQQRWDLRSGTAQVQAGERALAAARAERYPSLSVTADDGEIGTNPAQVRNTFTAVATLRVPVWQGGRTEGDVEQAQAVLDQRRAELEDTKGQVESDVRQAYSDLQAAATQVEVSLKNLAVTKETLDLTRQRFEAGVTDNVEVVQAQESVASAQMDYVNSVFAHNLAKLSLARAMGRVDQNLPTFLNTP